MNYNNNLRGRPRKTKPMPAKRLHIRPSPKPLALRMAPIAGGTPTRRKGGTPSPRLLPLHWRKKVSWKNKPNAGLRPEIRSTKL